MPRFSKLCNLDICIDSSQVCTLFHEKFRAGSIVLQLQRIKSYTFYIHVTVDDYYDSLMHNH